MGVQRFALLSVLCCLLIGVEIGAAVTFQDANNPEEQYVFENQDDARAWLQEGVRVLDESDFDPPEGVKEQFEREDQEVMDNFAKFLEQELFNRDARNQDLYQQQNQDLGQYFGSNTGGRLQTDDLDGKGGLIRRPVPQKPVTLPGHLNQQQGNGRVPVPLPGYNNQQQGSGRVPVPVPLPGQTNQQQGNGRVPVPVPLPGYNNQQQGNGRVPVPVPLPGQTNQQQGNGRVSVSSPGYNDQLQTNQNAGGRVVSPLQGCPKDFGYFPVPGDCTAFIHCDRGQAHQKRCGPGTVWSQRLLVCVHPNAEDCPGYYGGGRLQQLGQQQQPQQPQQNIQFGASYGRK